MTITAPEGLEGVVVASTALSDVDGEGGRLVIRGVPVEELAGRLPVEAVAAMLWQGLSSAEETPASVARDLGHARALAHEQMAHAFDSVARLVPIDALRALLSFVQVTDDIPMRRGSAHDAVAAHHLAAASLAVATAALGRLRSGQTPIAPDPSACHATDFLRMLRGTPPSPAHVSALDAYLVTVSDHGMNASTFTARVVASTGAGLLPAAIAALCALQGPLHGGAPGPVLDMLDAIATEGSGHDGRPGAAGSVGRIESPGPASRVGRSESPDPDRCVGHHVSPGSTARVGRLNRPDPGPGVGNDDGRDPQIEAWLERELAQGRRLMGFGHRIYRVRDPRADVLRDAVERLRGTDGGRLAFARDVESAALAVLHRHKPHRPLQTNVEFYTALLLEALGIDRALFTPTFAVGRAFGWTAHVLEQERTGRLIRPASRYVGPPVR